MTKNTPKSITKTIYIGNLPKGVTQEEILNLFTPFGQPTHFRFAKGYFDHEQNLNFAFLKLNSLPAMEKAVNKLNNLYFQHHYLLLELVDDSRFHLPKKE